MHPQVAENTLHPAEEIIRDARRPVLRLIVRNHPGVMSHICGLFARRAFNVEAILCLPIGDGSRSVILLLVDEDERLDQLIRQLEKLHDVLEIHRESDGHEPFEAMARYLESH
ncbi:MAG: acetolactate synthase 1 small subunit [Candidatus Hydrogenedentota bacterium]|nr:MAG: acetolactate synthase 1 small subunit [Candidatus Hydrogenedentota bacterium]GIX45202.1 MAG: acetolactate synthase isozyme 1 small subunit [Candidatus Sumerlaea sp.]